MPTAAVRAGSRGRRKATILAEAADLFAERGFAAVGVHEIGERAGISGGAIYRHFESKDAVLEAVLVDTIEAWVAAARTTDDEPDAATPLDRIRRMVSAAVQLVVDRPGQLATYLRERHRAGAATKRSLARREATLAAAWTAAILDQLPGLGEEDVALRQLAINGVLSSLAQRPAALAQPRFRSLLPDGLVALVADPTTVDGQPPMAERLWRAPVSRRQQIVEAAAALFRRHGYHGVGIDEIGEAAGISGPAVYEYFPAKRDILVDVYDQAGALVVAGTTNALRAADSAADALERITRSIVDITFEWLDLMIVTAQEGHSLPEAERPRLARRERHVYETWIGVLRALRPELTPTEAKALVVAILPMVGHVAQHRRGSSLPRESVVAVVRAFLLGEERK